MASRKNRKIKKTRKRNEFHSLKINLIKNKNIIQALSNFKNNSSVIVIQKYFKELTKIKTCRDLIFSNPFPKELSEIAGIGQVYMGDLEREILWASMILSCFSQEINSFLKLRSQFESKILYGNFQEAEKTLEKIKDQFGYSLWYLENKISLLQECYGLDEQKAFCHSITSNQDVDPLINYIIYYSSIRAEKNVSNSKYDSICREAIDSAEDEPHFSDYLKYRLNYYSEVQEIKQVAVVFAIEQTYPIIDRYISFNKICKLLSSGVLSTKFSINSFRKSISYITAQVHDCSATNLNFILQIDEVLAYSEETKLVLNVLNLYSVSNYAETETLSLTYINDKKASIAILEKYVKSLISQNKKLSSLAKSSYAEQIIFSMYNMLMRNTFAGESFHKLIKLVYLFPDHRWAPQIISFLCKENHFGPVNFSHPVIRYGHLHSSIQNPSIALSLSPKRANEFLENLSRLYDESTMVNLIEVLIKKEPDKIENLSQKGLTNDKLLKYKAEIHRNKENYDQAIYLYQKLLDCPNYLVFQDAIAGLSACYLKTNAIEECISLVVDKILKNDNLKAVLPIVRLLETIENVETEISKSNLIAIPILYDFYSRNFSKDKDVLRYEAYEDFLLSNDVERPSELKLEAIDSKRAYILYYLRNLCTQQVMDSSVYFDSSEQIDRERIKVCQMLCEMDEDNYETYTDEIKDITQKIMINKGIQEIEQSKIYVDVEGIKKAIEKDLEDSYRRYVDFPDSSQKDGLDEQNYYELSKILKTTSNQVHLLIPRNEKLDLLKNIYLEIRDLFVTSNEYGLDTYLSVGIRHGTLSGQLRSQLESLNLITQKDVKTNRYKDNNYWKEKYFSFMPSDQEALMKCLADLSEKIDNLIKMLRKEWIQIKTEKKESPGFFDYTITNLDLKIIELQLNKQDNYEDFVDVIFSNLWEKTEDCLLKIRTAIQNDLKEQFNEVFSAFLEDINQFKSRYNVSELESKINQSSTSIQYELDKIANWFKRSEVSLSSDYEINLPIKIGAEMINNTNPTKKIRPIINSNITKLLKGETMNAFVNIFYMLFSNIATHCRFESTIIDVDIEINHDGKILHLTVENQDSKNIDYEKENERLYKIKEDLTNGELPEIVRKEGGSGFSKIKKIVSFDLQCTHDIDFRYSDNSSFIVNINMESRGLLT